MRVGLAARFRRGKISESKPGNQIASRLHAVVRSVPRRAQRDPMAPCPLRQILLCQVTQTGAHEYCGDAVLSSSRSDLTRRGSSRWNLGTRFAPPAGPKPHEQPPPDQPRSGLPDAAIGRRVAAATPPRAVRGGGDRGIGSAGDDRQRSAVHHGIQCRRDAGCWGQRVRVYS